MTRAGRTREKDSSGHRRLGTGLRCAVYTRKSSEEGLEQDFNSLHAQREACEAFILSQKHEGWAVLPGLYDDGGYSGGTIERPAIERLLDDVRAGRIDVVVVYKVDRLTRSLADFAKIVEIFDASGVSFVSVTQQFNTTSSMGRLTLNVLLSFAQFEREVTGERIRDKIAASKKKGMWMGGFVPLGYEPKDRSLVINEGEAETVRTLFRLYLKFGNVRLVKKEADRLGLRSKLHSGSNGRIHGGVSFSRGAIYKILSNPIYIGEIAHKGERHKAIHPPIVDRETWEAVQKRLQENSVRQRNQANAQSPSLLAGLIFDEAGEPLTPSHANKKGRRYRYYVSRSLLQGAAGSPGDRAGGTAAASSWRLPATEIETLAVGAVSRMLRDRAGLIDRLGLSERDPRYADQVLFVTGELANELDQATGPAKRVILADLIQRMEIGLETVAIRVDSQRLLNKAANGDAVVHNSSNRDAAFELRIAVRFSRRGSEVKLVLADPGQPAKLDRRLISNVARGFAWAEELRTGIAESIGAIAARENLSPGFIRRFCDLAFLPTALTEGIVAGHSLHEITSESLKRAYPLPVRWDDQMHRLGDRIPLEVGISPAST